VTKEYLVVHDLGQLSGITIERAGRSRAHRIECWALDDGKRVVFARMQMWRLLRHYHVGGSYSDMAKYGLSYGELLRVVASRIGPCDRERYELTIRTAPRAESPGAWPLIETVATGALETLWVVFRGSVKFVLVVVLLPFVIMFFNRHGGHRR